MYRVWLAAVVGSLGILLVASAFTIPILPIPEGRLTSISRMELSPTILTPTPLSFQDLPPAWEPNYPPILSAVSPPETMERIANITPTPGFAPVPPPPTAPFLPWHMKTLKRMYLEYPSMNPAGMDDD